MKFIKTPKNQFLFFILLFFIVNFIQSYTTGLLNDESYYWVWSKELAFGYFDHPPLVALWIKISSLFFNGELGVRFFSTISFSLVLFFIWKCIDTEKKQDYVWLYFLLIASVALLNVYGFITVPDTPLVLFTAIFLFAYKRFLEVNSLKYTLLLGVTMAGMLYSKYHGILVIIFVLISNFSLLKNKRFWIAGIFGALLFAPHILWQLEQDFPSIKYHLFERGKKPYKFEYTLMHFVNLIAIVGLPFPLIYTAFFKQKIDTLFKKGLQYIVLGFIIFFFFSTFKTSTQAQWNGPILIPLIVLTFGYFVEHKKARKWLLYLGIANLVIILVARIFLASAVLSPINLETHNGKAWAQKIKEKTNSRPIVFKSSYKRASKYNFYAGIKAHSFSTLKTRKSQYDLFDFEQQMQHKNVTIIADGIQGYKIFETHKTMFYGEDIDNYVSFQKFECTISEDQLILNTNKKNALTFEIFNPYDFTTYFNDVKFVGVFQGKKNAILKEIPLEVGMPLSLGPSEKKVIRATFIVPATISSKVLTFRVALKFYQLPTGFQGNKVKTTIINE